MGKRSQAAILRDTHRLLTATVVEHRNAHDQARAHERVCADLRMAWFGVCAGLPTAKYEGTCDEFWLAERQAKQATDELGFMYQRATQDTFYTLGRMLEAEDAAESFRLFVLGRGVAEAQYWEWHGLRNAVPERVKRFEATNGR